MLDNGVQLTPENGNMVGPTKQGMQDLIDLDPNASWDTSCKCVVGSDPKYNGNSPRIRPIPVYDPVAFANGKAHGKNITLDEVTTIGFFIEPMNGGQVVGRITPIHVVDDTNAGPAPPGSFPRAEAYYESALSLPLYTSLERADQERVLAILGRALH